MTRKSQEDLADSVDDDDDDDDDEHLKENNGI